MKRKSDFEAIINNSKTLKMERNAEINYESNRSIIVATGWDVTQSLERIFNYKLSDKKAKSIFLRSAAREALEIDEKGVCTMLNLSVGSYHEVIIPLMTELIPGEMKLNDYDVRIFEVIPTYDENRKHVETIVKVGVNNTKITVTFYNTTQRVKIEGKGYIDIGRKVIIPLIKDRIANTSVEDRAV